MQDPRDNRIYTDENGDQWATDENGKVLTDGKGNKFVPQQTTRKTSKEGEFTTYNTSQGHCGLCGSLTCSGNCFK